MFQRQQINRQNYLPSRRRLSNHENLYGKKTEEHFKVFIGFKNHMCINLSITTDGFLDDLNSDSILANDKKDLLRRIYCPFKAICLVNFPEIKQGEKVNVDAVKLTVEIKEVFIVKCRIFVK